MRVRVLFGVASLVPVVGMLWGSVTPAGACSCAGLTPEEYAARANVVVVARLTEIRYDPPLTVPYSESRQTLVDLHVERYLKGSGPELLTVVDPGHIVIEAENGVPKFGGVSCSIFQDQAAKLRYLLLIDGTDSPIEADFCGGSLELDNPNTPESAKHLASVERALGETQLPAGGGPLTASDNATGLPIVRDSALTALGLLALLVGAALVWRSGRISQRMRN
jgi:hypothetical protein